MAESSGKFAIRILDKGLNASIKVFALADEEGAEPTVEEALKELKEAGVVFGINETVLNSIFVEKNWDSEVVVATGDPAIDGENGKIRYFFEKKREIKPSEDEKGNVDYRDINLIQNVKQGQKLAEVIPPVPGKEGKDVSAKVILPKLGVVKKLPMGANTEASPENENILLASKDGNVTVSESGIIQVESIFEVKGDVDFNTGNINYVGTVIVKGNVRSGFEIHTEGDLEINGLVEDALLQVGGNVIIKKGFLGKNQGKIEAGGDVILKFCENQNIVAKGDIIVGEGVLHSNILSESKIEVTGRKGQIVGGYTSAISSIAVKELGNYQEIKTEITVGINEELEKKLKNAVEEIEKATANIDNVKKAIVALFKKKAAVGKLPDDQANLLKKLQNLQTILPGQIETLTKEKEKIEEEIKQFAADASIKVTGPVHRGVHLRILDKRKSITEEDKAITYKIIDSEIQGFR